MFEWLKKKVPCVGSVLFRGSLPPRPGEFQRLSGAGLSVKNLPQADGVRWGLELAHPEWGKATLQCARDTSPPPHLITDWMYGLTAQEREEVRQAGCGLDLRMEGRRAHVLRDRKTFLRFLRAVMADDGLVACDWVGRRLWARAELEDELSHDADLDIGQIFEVHAVQRNDSEAKQPGEEYGEQSESREVRWLHTHGLAEIGYFDFDIVRPAPELLHVAGDALRSIAFAIVEGGLARSTRSYTFAWPGGHVRCVDVAEFARRADPEVAALRDADEHHDANRVVLCEPAGRLFGRSRVKPSGFLSGPIDDGATFGFSTEATNLMAERASRTLPLLRRLAAEMEPFEFPVLIKLGYRVDGGGEDDREHLWFQVHRILSGGVDATLLNGPIRVSKLKEGQRDQYPLELLSDWAIMTPWGRIDPRSMNVARFVQTHREEFLAIMRQENAADEA